MSAKIQFSDDHKVGDILVGHLIMKAGCSNYPWFGVIVKITPAGKYRIYNLETIRVEDHPKNWSNQTGSYTVIVPGTKKTGENSLASKIEKSDDLSDDEDDNLWGKNTCWNRYDSSKEYAHCHDNGD